MVKINLFLITVSLSVRKREAVSFAQRYEDNIRINRLVDDVKRKRDEHMRYFH